MMEKMLELKVLNVKQLKHDSMVGWYKVDLGLVYSQLNHCYIQKWLVLVDTRHGGSYTKVRYIYIGICGVLCVTLRKWDLTN